jgi:hypothetical protein
MIPRIHWPTRNTKLMSIRINNVHLWYSYETLMAASGTTDGQWLSIRRENHWGPTTGRHLKESSVGGYRILPDEEFESLAMQMLVEGAKHEIIDTIEKRMDRTCHKN